MSETRGLSISITVELLEELLTKHIKNVPNDLKFVYVEVEWYNRSLRFYFKSKQFPIVKDQLKANVIHGQVEATTDKNGKLMGLVLKWRDPNKKEKD